MPNSYQTARIIGATPKRLFEAWMDSLEHSDMTGTVCTMGTEVGDSFNTIDGQVIGRTLKLEPYHRIQQRWISEEPGGRSFESRLEIAFLTGPDWGGLPGSAADGATVTIRHWGLPPEQRLFAPQW